MEYWQKLPHFDHIGAAFFVTFRLKNSIDAKTAKKLKKERHQARSKAFQARTNEEQDRLLYEAERHYFLKYDGLLDHPTLGDRYLTEKHCMTILKDVMHEYDGLYYSLEAFSIMSNHVHLLIDTSVQLPIAGSMPNLKKYQYLKDIMRRIKGKTGLFINKQRGTSGKIWEEESYDRYIRSPKHFWYS